MWCGEVLCGVVLCGVLWCGIVWCGEVLYCVVWEKVDMRRCHTMTDCVVYGLIDALLEYHSESHG